MDAVQKNEELEQKYAQVQETADEYEMQKHSTEVQIDELQRQIHQFQEESEQKNIEMEDYKRQADEKSSIIMENKNVIQSCKKSMNDLQEKYNNIERLNQELQADIHELKEQHKEEEKRILSEAKNQLEEVNRQTENDAKENKDTSQLSHEHKKAIERKLLEVFKEKIRKIGKEYAKKEKKLKVENMNLKEEIDRMHSISEFEGHKNPSQKIKHYLDIKTENNKLRSQNQTMEEEMKKIKDTFVKEALAAKSQSIKSRDEKIKKLKKEVERKIRDLHEAMHNGNKLCDYILSRAVLPEDLKRCETGTKKLDKAQEAIAYMSRAISKRDKELIEMKKKKETLEFEHDISKNQYIMTKKSLDMLISSSAGQN